jgi:hypothetical protein
MELAQDRVKWQATNCVKTWGSVSNNRRTIFRCNFENGGIEKSVLRLRVRINTGLQFRRLQLKFRRIEKKVEEMLVCGNQLLDWSQAHSLTRWLPWGHRWVTGLYRLYGGSVFKQGNNVFLTPQLGRERCMRFVRATGASRSSYRKSFFAIQPFDAARSPRRFY